MNKHILELAYKAGYGTRWTSTEQFDQFIEKFAKLVVLECTKVSVRAGALNEAAYEGEMIADAIHEHFWS